MSIPRTDPVSVEITKWLRTNIEKLVRHTVDENFSGYVKSVSTTKKKNALDLPSEVLRSEHVCNFPCVRNVELSAKRIVLNCIKNVLQSSSLSEQSKNTIVLTCGNTTKLFSFPPYMRLEHKSSLRFGSKDLYGPEFVGQTVLEGDINVRMPLCNALSYWKIINKASFYNNNRGSFVKDLKRFGLKWKGETTIKRERVAMIMGAASSFDPRLEGTAGEVKGWYGDLSTGRPEFRVQLEEMMQDIVPIASQSRAVRAVVCIKDDEGRSHGSESKPERLIIKNDTSHSFWNSLYLFHVEGEKGYEEGVAINTVSGLVSNAKFRFSNRFECTISRATVERWNRFIKKDNGDIQWEAFRTLTRPMWVNVCSQY